MLRFIKRERKAVKKSRERRKRLRGQRAESRVDERTHYHPSSEG
jgi:hypothetical protein